MRSSLSRRSGAVAAAAAMAVLGAGAAPALAQAPDPLLALDSNNSIRVVNPNTPSALAPFVPIRGLKAGEIAAGLDYVAATQQVLLFTTTGTTYVLTNDYLALPASEAVTGGTFGVSGVDWNPTTINTPAPRIRIFAGNQNFRYRTEEPRGYINDGVFSFPFANLVGAAYTNNDTITTTGTTLYSLDATTDFLFSHDGPPAFSTVNGVGATGIAIDDVTGFDISGATGTAYAAARNGAIDSTLYTIDLATGAATAKGKVSGGGARITGLTAVPPSFFPPVPPAAKCGQPGGGPNGLLSGPLNNIAALLGSRQSNPIGQLVSTVNCNIIRSLGL